MVVVPPVQAKATSKEEAMLNALLETIGTLGVLASIVMKIVACWPKAQSQATRRQ
jgi:hypothetical protein